MSTGSSSETSSYAESIVTSFIFPDDDEKSSKKITLYQELRLIERNESEINVCWKGAHMMLFFMAFVFGSLCTFCFHRLLFMFDEKCVLYPKVVSHTTIHRLVNEFLSFTVDPEDPAFEQPVDFVTTQWTESSVCYLPTYVPLVSGLSGLVWTTMFLMCSSGTSHNVTGAQRHWRALPVMFLFCLAMSVLCIYTSLVTHGGLRDFCSKLAVATGSPRCSYTLNVATLAFERRIRGVYQATLLSIASAWLHTGCWILSTLLILARLLLAVDFTLVYVRAHLLGNLDDILQKFETQVNTFNTESEKPYKLINEEDSETELFSTRSEKDQPIFLLRSRSRSFTTDDSKPSVISLVPEERQRLLKLFIQDLLYDILEKIGQPASHNATVDSLRTYNADSSENLAKEHVLKLQRRFSEEFLDFTRQIKLDLKNVKNDEADPNTANSNSEGTEHGEIVFDKKTGENENYKSAKRTHHIHFDSDKTENESKESDKGTLSRLVGLDGEPAPRLESMKEIKEHEKKDEKIKDEKSEDRDTGTVRQYGQLQIFDKPTDDDRSAPEKKENETVSKAKVTDQFIEENKNTDKLTKDDEPDKGTLRRLVRLHSAQVQEEIKSDDDRSTPEKEESDKDQKEKEKTEKEKKEK